jgi:hypothetical protein
LRHSSDAALAVHEKGPLTWENDAC